MGGIEWELVTTYSTYRHVRILLAQEAWWRFETEKIEQTAWKRSWNSYMYTIPSMYGRKGERERGLMKRIGKKKRRLSSGRRERVGFVPGFESGNEMEMRWEWDWNTHIISSPVAIHCPILPTPRLGRGISAMKPQARITEMEKE